MESVVLEEKDFLACCGSVQFAKEMASAAPFSLLDDAVKAAREIWFNKVDVNAWLEAFAAHPQIGESPSNHETATSAKWSKGEQSAAFATATDSTLQELADWNRQYRDKFGFIFLICASGKTTPEILSEVKRRYTNRPIVEFEIAAMEQLKITELRLAKLFQDNKQEETSPKTNLQVVRDAVEKVTEDRLSIIGSHIASVSLKSPRTSPPITTHVLDTARGSPAAGVEVQLEMWDGNSPRPSFGEIDDRGWIFQGLSITDKDGRSGRLMKMVETLSPGMYRISFNTGKYCPDGFFPYVSLVFEVRETQTLEHFHVPLLLSPFSFTTYRGS